MVKPRNTLKHRITVIFILLLPITWNIPGGLASGVVSAPLSNQPGVENGMVRVYLSSLGNPTSLTLTSAGNYSVNGDKSQSLANGHNCTVSFSSSTGMLTLTSNGVKTNMGTSFSLRRHSAAGENGIKIAQGRVPGNLYPGDISFQSVRQSNGTYKLYPIAHLYLENYLYGVLPYEMGNGSHLEALKAQAVAARTYTVSMMKTRAAGIYDVVDTTNDQVYNGMPSGNANCVAAVDATKGIVVMNGTTYTGTYYSASNGGQTEAIANAWGTAGYGYLGVKDDPFDLANPDSVVKRVTVNASCAVSGANASFLALLKNKALVLLNSQGYSATSTNTDMHTIKDMQLHTPKYQAPSRLYTKLDVTLAISTVNRSGSKVNATVTVTCSVFSELKSILGMGIQSSDNELWTVRKSIDDFTLEARRFGHGIGLSQRGAMYMGKLGYTYDQILGFYYSGCRRMRVSFTNTVLSSNSAQLQTTVETPADFMENPVGCTGVIKLVGASSSLAIRDSKSLTGNTLGVIANNSPVNVYSNDGAWCFIHFGNIRGYVPADALILTGTAPAAAEENATKIDGFATVTANGFLNLRASGNSAANIVTTAPTGAILTVFSRSNGWAHIQFGATVAYAFADFLAFASVYPGNAASSGSAMAVVNLDGNTGSVNMRNTPSTTGGVLAQIPHGTAVAVTRSDGSWCTVVYNGVTGYVAFSYLRFENENINGGAQQEPGSAEITATVKTTVGYIREMDSESSPSSVMVALGQSVIILERGDIWCKVRYEGVTGHMLTASLAFQGIENGTGMKAIVATQSGSLNLRSSASAGSGILAAIPKGAEITVVSRDITWSAVRYHGIFGYAMTCYLLFTDDAGSGAEPPVASGDVAAYVFTPSGSLNLRAEARAGSVILRTVPRLANITVHQRGVEWCHVTFAGTKGYVMTAFLVFEGETVPDITYPETPEPSDEEDSEGMVLPEDPDAANALYGVVTTASGSLNLRQDAMPGSPILARIPKGTTIRITQRLAVWSQTAYAGRQGYVMNAYLTFVTGQKLSGSAITAMVVTVSGSLNLRAEPSAAAGILARIPQYAYVDVHQRGNAWCHVSYGGRYGYVMTRYLTFEQDGIAGDGQDGAGEALVKSAARVRTSGGTLNLREEPSSQARIITTIPNGAAVEVLAGGDAWHQVRYGEMTGFVMGQYLWFPQGQSAGETYDLAAGGGGGDRGNAVGDNLRPAAVAWVNTPSGGLNLRESASDSAAVLAVIPRLAQVEVMQGGTAWSQVRYNGLAGYVMSGFLSGADPGAYTESVGGENTADGETGKPGMPPATEQPAAEPAAEDVKATDPTLKAVEREMHAWVSPVDSQPVIGLWPECAEQGKPQANMLPGAQVTVLMAGDTWCQIKYFDATGYCLKKHLNFEAP